MSTAVSVKGCEPNSLDWITIEDNDGQVWRYRRGKLETNGNQFHIKGEYHQPKIVATLRRDEESKVVLSQPEPGLPKQIVIHVVAPAGTASPTGTANPTWGSNYEYEREESPVTPSDA